MSFAGLCELAESRGWVVVVAANHGGSVLQKGDDPAYLRTLAIYEDRQSWRTHMPPLVSVRLDEPVISLNAAAEALGQTLHAAGVF